MDDEAQLPSELSLEPAPWLAASPWARRELPAFAGRRERLRETIAGQLVSAAPDLARPTLALVDAALACRPGAVGARLEPLDHRLAQIRGHGDSPPLQFVHCVIASLDVHARRAADNPALAGVRAAGWVEVPRRYLGALVELTLLHAQWRDPRNHARLRDDPRDACEQTFAVQSFALASAAAALAGAPASLGWLRAETTHAAAGGRYFSAGLDYLFAVIRVLPADDPQVIPLYEAYADQCDLTQVHAVESGTLALARACGRDQPEVLLRAALRAWCRHDYVHGPARADAAFTALPANDRDGKALAAALAGLFRSEDDRLAARAWLLTASTLCAGEASRFHDGLLAAIARLEAPRGRLVAVGPVIADPPHGEASNDPPWAEDDGFREIRVFLATTMYREAHECFSEFVALQIDALGRTGAIAQLTERTRALERRLGAELNVDGVSAEATLAVWVRAALADLHDDDGDLEQWKIHTLRRLTLEDSESAVPEHLTDLDTTRSLLQFVDPTVLAIKTNRLDRVGYCLEEAEQAFAAGAAQKARFWAERAQHYRDLLPKE